jgi:tripartite-type tricarboxylate transporter receptor subunit TctC
VRNRLLAALLAIVPCVVAAQGVPPKPIQLVVPFSPGNVVVENKPGANGNIGAEFVRRAPADGHTLLIAANAFVILAAMPPQPFDFVRELVAFAKARPASLSYASAGNGSPHQVAMELLKLQAGIDVTHVPYKGMGQGGVNLLALQPDVPTIAESGLPGYQMDAWIGLLAPAGTPRPAIDRLNGELNRVLKLPQVREKLAAQGLDALGGTPEGFSEVKAAGIKAD